MEYTRSVIFITILVLVLLTSCATPTPESEPVTLTFACQDYQRELYQDLAQAFHEDHPSIDVQIRSVNEMR